MSADMWKPEDVPLDKPNAARIYDYLLGGYHNFEVDRMVAEKMIELYPDMRVSAQANRAFLRRAVRFLATEGIEQFLDIGSGIPTAGNVHEVAQQANPAARVVYVDVDPVAVAHSRSMLQDNPNATIIRGDVGQPAQILNHAEVRKLLDFSRPVGVLLVAVLHYITDDEMAYGAVRTLRDALAPGSYVVVSHASFEGAAPEAYEQISRLYAQSTAQNRVRSRAEIERFFDGFELVEPGLVRCPLWRPESPDDVLLDRPEWFMGFCGVGRKL